MIQILLVTNTVIWLVRLKCLSFIENHVSSVVNHRGGCRAIKGGGNSTRFCTMRMRNLLTTPTFGISRWLTTIPGQKIMVISSEIIEIIARSSDVLCIYCIFWTKGR